jgi:hypothetical protein
MKYLKYFENHNEITQQPFYISGDHLYLSEEVAKRAIPTLKELKDISKDKIWINRRLQDQDDFFNGIRNANGYLKVRDIHLNKSVSYNDMYSMNLSLYKMSPTINNKFGSFNIYLNGNSGDYFMHEKNMKRATRECNLKFIIKLYPIVAHIKNFYKMLKDKKPFSDIIKEALDKDIMLAQYGIPKEIKHLFDDGVEGSVIQQIKFNI